MKTASSALDSRMPLCNNTNASLHVNNDDDDDDEEEEDEDDDEEETS